MRTAYLEITESRPGQAIAVRQATVDDSSLTLHFPAHCKATLQRRRAAPPLRVYRLRCERGLAGGRLRFVGFGAMITEAVVRVRLADGRLVSTLLTGRDPAWQIPPKRSTTATVGAYLWLGVTHVLGGLDHLLFVLALLLLVHGRGAILLTITAFTVSHSLTLGLTALEWLHVSAPAAEACIAWSLVLSAWEVTRREQLAHPDQMGVAMGFLFGFVHGLGFAGALREIGLPQDAVVWSLISFNLGVELGQVAFALPGVALLTWLRRREQLYQRVAIGAAYCVGVPGAYWFWQRLAALVG